MNPSISRIYTLKNRRNVFICTIVFFFLSSFLNYAAESSEWTDIERIVVVADIHGNYDNLIRILKGTEIIDENRYWNGGKTHLVQTGDIMDRGPDARKVFDLFMKLEKQAEFAGGKVHILLGNHDVMNLTGIALQTTRYVTPEQFRSFLPEIFRNQKEKSLEKRLLKTGKPVELSKNEISNYWNEKMQVDEEARAEYSLYFIQKYGNWLLTKNLVIRINDIVFVHGGINEEFSKWKMKNINSRVQKEIQAIQSGKRITIKIVYQADAPQWFRGLILNEEDVFSDDVDRILNNLNAKYMVVGHTVRQKDILNSKKLDRFQGRVWGMDTGISEYYGGNISALIIEKGIFRVWWSENEEPKSFVKIPFFVDLYRWHVSW